MLVHNSDEALSVKGKSKDDADDGPLHQRYCWTERTGTLTMSTRKKRYAIVVGDSLLRETEGPVCWTDFPCREGCCLSAAWTKDITRKALRGDAALGFLPITALHEGDDAAATSCPRAIKRDVTVCKGIHISVVSSDSGRQQKGMMWDYVGASVSIRKSWWNAVYQALLQPTAHLALCCVVHHCMPVSVLTTGTWFQRLHWSPPEYQSCYCVCFCHIRTKPLQSPLRRFYLYPLERSRIYILVRSLTGVSLEGQLSEWKM